MVDIGCNSNHKFGQDTNEVHEDIILIISLKESTRAIAGFHVTTCCKPCDQPRDTARQEECSGLDEKSLCTFCHCDGRAKGIAREHQNGFL